MVDAETCGVANKSSWKIGRVMEALRRMLQRVSVRRRERTLRICETLPLSDKRFLAIVECEKGRMLIGVTNQSITLLEQWESVKTSQNRNQILESSFLRGVH